MLLMKEKELINEQNNAGETALHLTLDRYVTNCATAYMLIENGADTHIKNNEGLTAEDILEDHPHADFWEGVTKLIKEKFWLTLEDHYRVIYDYARKWRGVEYDDYNLFVYHMARKILQQIDQDDDTELVYVIKLMKHMLYDNKDCELLQILYEEGYDLCMPICEGAKVTTVRDFCVEIAWEKLYLLIKLKELGVDLDTALLGGRTPANILADHSVRWDAGEHLLEALEFCSVESMEALNNEGMTAIHLAARHGSHELLQRMIEKGVDVNITTDAPAETGNTPLHIACMYQHPEAVKVLLAAGADDTLRNSADEMPAHCLVKNKIDVWKFDDERCYEIMEMLSDIDSSAGKNNETPLLLLQKIRPARVAKVTELLLRKGADVNHADNDGNTPLAVHADHHCERDVIKLMLKVGADINSKDRNGDSVLHHVLDHGDCELARLLIKKGADYNVANNKGETPATIAIEKGYETVLELMTDIEVYTSADEDSFELDDDNRVYGSCNDYDDYDDDDDEDYDEEDTYSDEQREAIQREKEYQITFRTYAEIFGEKIGKQLADLVTRMGEMNRKGLVQDNMEEYMQLSNQFQAIMNSEDGLRKIAEYNARAAAHMYSGDED